MKRFVGWRSIWEQDINLQYGAKSADLHRIETPIASKKSLIFFQNLTTYPYRVNNKKKELFAPENKDVPQVFDLLFLRETHTL